MTDRKAGWIALVGEPNVGKSTLLNCLVGASISIVTHKAQTTRFRIRGITAEGNAQLVFVDTPGLFNPKSRLDQAMVGAAWKGAAEADVILFIAEAHRGASERFRPMIESLQQRQRPEQKLALVLNKIDLASSAALLEAASSLARLARFDAVFMISALNDDGVRDVRSWLAGNVPPGPWHFPEDQISDLPERIIAAEITRGRLMLRLHEEIPYRLTVETESWKELKDGSVRIEQVIHVARQGHKGMVIGQGGRAIKQVSAEARKELAEFLRQDVHLFLRVKVRPNWVDDVSRFIAADPGS